MAQMKKENKAKIKKYIARLLRDRHSDIVGKWDKPSPDKIVALVEKELNLHVTRTTVRSYINNEDMDKYLANNNFEGNEQIKEYNEMMQSARSIWENESDDPNHRTKAYNSYLRAKKQKEQLEERLADEILKKAEVSRPNYLIKFNPSSALRKCPRCGHEFYDRETFEKVDKEKAAWNMKPQKGQKKFDDFGSDNVDEKKANEKA